MLFWRGLTRRFQPGSIHIAILPEQIAALECEVRGWDCAPIHFYDETEFFGLGDRSKSALCQRIASLPKLYQAWLVLSTVIEVGLPRSDSRIDRLDLGLGQ